MTPLTPSADSTDAETGEAAILLEYQDGTLSLTVSDDGKGFDLAAAGMPSGGISSKYGLFSIEERMRGGRRRLGSSLRRRDTKRTTYGSGVACG